MRHLMSQELLLFYLTCTRPVTEYACSVYHHSLPQYLSFDLDGCQRRALCIIYPDCSYVVALAMTGHGLLALHERRELLINKLFNPILCNASHELCSLLVSKKECEVNLRNKRAFTYQTTHPYYSHSQ